MELKAHQKTLLHAYADGELGIEAVIDVQKLLMDSEEARLEFKNICVLKNKLKTLSDTTVTDEFKNKLKNSLCAEVEKSTLHIKRTRPRSLTFSWVAAAVIMVLMSMLGFKMLKSNNLIVQKIASFESIQQKDKKGGGEVVDYISTTHGKLLKNNGPTFKVRNVNLVTEQINHQWQGVFHAGDFEMDDAEFMGFCVCKVPLALASTRFSYRIVVDGKREYISFYIINSTHVIDCDMLQDRVSKDRLYKVGNCSNKYNIVQWQTGRLTYFMVSRVNNDILIAMMDKILRH